MWHEWKSRSLGAVIASRLRAWRMAFDTPNPWPDEVDRAVRSPEAVPVCHRCITPCDRPVWFCPSCGASIGPYNNILPFIRIYALGEVLRSGVGPSARFTRLTVPGYLFLGIQHVWFLAPFYYARLLMNYLRIKRQRVAGQASCGEPPEAEAECPPAWPGSHSEKNHDDP